MLSTLLFAVVINAIPEIVPINESCLFHWLYVFTNENAFLCLFEDIMLRADGWLLREALVYSGIEAT